MVVLQTGTALQAVVCTYHFHVLSVSPNEGWSVIPVKTAIGKPEFGFQIMLRWAASTKDAKTMTNC
jgi:hypothetical protein